MVSEEATEKPRVQDGSVEKAHGAVLNTVSSDKDVQKTVKYLSGWLTDDLNNNNKAVSNAMAGLVGKYTDDKRLTVEVCKLFETFPKGVFNPDEKFLRTIIDTDLKRGYVAVGCLKVYEPVRIVFQKLLPFYPEIIKEKAEVRRSIAAPKDLVTSVLTEHVATDEFKDLDTAERCEFLRDMPTVYAEPVLKKLADTRDPKLRVTVFNSLWFCGLGSRKSDRLTPILSWITSRLSKEESRVKAPVVETLLTSDIMAIPSSAVRPLEELFTYSLKWGDGPWMTSWGTWAATISLQYAAVKRVKEHKLLTFARHILKRLLTASVATAKDHIISLGKAVSTLKILDIPNAPKHAGDVMYEYIKDAFSKSSKYTYFYSFSGTDEEKMVKSNMQKLKEIIAHIGGFPILLQNPRIAGFAEMFLPSLDEEITFETSGDILKELREVSEDQGREWPAYREVVERTLKKVGRHYSPEDGAKRISEYIAAIPPKSVKDQRPILQVCCSALLAQANKQTGAVPSDVVAMCKTHLIANMDDMTGIEFEFVEDTVKAVINWAAIPKSTYTWESSYTPYDITELLNAIGSPSPSTKGIFKHALGVISPKDGVGICMIRCEPKRDNPERIHTASSKTARPRFRFQRGHRAAKRHKNTKALKNSTKTANAKFEGWAANPVLGLIDRMKKAKISCDGVSRYVRQAAEHSPISENKKRVIRALLDLFENCSTPEKNLSLPTGFRELPETAEFIKKHVDIKHAEIAVSAMLDPKHFRLRRLDQMLSAGLGKVTPSELFRESSTFQKYVLEHRPNEVPRLMGPMSKTLPWLLPGLATGVRKARFGGQTTTVSSSVYLLPPKVQQYLWDNWVVPTGFDVSHLSCDSAWNTNKDYDHRSKAEKLWVACAMGSAPNIPKITDDKHPFNIFFKQAVTDREATRKLTTKEQDNVVKSDKLTTATIHGSRAAQLCLELLLALRTVHEGEAALRVITQHIDVGVSSKVAIPSAACALACLPPKTAAGLLKDVLQRSSTKASARSQLGRCCVKLLAPADIERFVEMEWKEGGWVLLGSDSDSCVSTAEEMMFTSTKVALLCSLVATPVLQDAPALWDRMQSISLSRTDENIYIAGQVLASLAGTNGVTTLNSKAWPPCACPGLAKLVASFSDVPSLFEVAKTVLMRYFKMLSVTDHPPAEEDAEGVVKHLIAAKDSELLTAMVGALTPYRPGLLAEVCKTKQKQISVALAQGNVEACLTAKRILKSITSEKRCNVPTVECEKAIQVLVETPSTVVCAYGVIGKQWARNLKSVDEGELDNILRTTANVLGKVGRAGELVTEPCYEGLDMSAFPTLVEKYMRFPEKVPMLLRFVVLTVMHASPAFVSPQLLKFVVSCAGEATAVVSSAAYATLEKVPRGCYRISYELVNDVPETEEEKQKKKQNARTSWRSGDW
eukprot:TRINITY_DN55_c1_g1_i2.p1 TRINITY_DN55_c1_g1~~TRINITY_DN55_c1_g1_i2.p1  ORF type:complete len:1424 (+),score=263.51 TRINITY_DN55_c1_g1_i2:861-5132(+)